MGAKCVRSFEPGQEKAPQWVACVRAFEPGFDQTPHWLQEGHSLHSGFDESEFDKVIRDGHEQGPLEAMLEAWAYGGRAPVRQHTWHGAKRTMSGGPVEARGQPRRVVLNLYNMPRDAPSVRRTPQFHCGVEVDDCEWSFADESTGSAVFTGSGVFHSIPRKSAGKRFDESAFVGTTTTREDEVLRIVQAMKKEWRSSSFDAVSCNSLHFCQDLCKRLNAGPIPAWVKISVNCTVKPQQPALVQSLCCLPQMMSSILCCESHVDTHNSELVEQINTLSRQERTIRRWS